MHHRELSLQMPNSKLKESKDKFYLHKSRYLLTVVKHGNSDLQVLKDGLSAESHIAGLPFAN